MVPGRLDHSELCYGFKGIVHRPAEHWAVQVRVRALCSECFFFVFFGGIRLHCSGGFDDPACCACRETCTRNKSWRSAADTSVPFDVPMRGVLWINFKIVFASSLPSATLVCVRCRHRARVLMQMVPCICIGATGLTSAQQNLGVQACTVDCRQ